MSTEVMEILENNKEEENMSIVSTLHQPEVMEMINARNTARIQGYINAMANGVFFNLNINKMDSCDGIVMLASGKICPIFRDSICCLNPLEHRDDHVVLSTFSIAGNVIPNATSITKTVEKYNTDLLEYITRYGIKGAGDDCIIAYYSFTPGW